MIIALMVAVLVGGGTYLVLQRGMLRIIVGMTMISHAANLIILSSGVGAWRGEPLLREVELDQAADPLPQAFVLTAIVITMAVTAFMLALAGLGRDDDTLIKADREAMNKLVTERKPSNKHIPSDSDSTITGADNPSAGTSQDSLSKTFPRNTPHGGDEKW